MDVLAGKIAERLKGSMISSALPAEIGAWIRESCKHGAYWCTHMIPMGGATCMVINYKLHPDGSVHMEWKDTCGQIFWQGIFRPVADESLEEKHRASQ